VSTLGSDSIVSIVIETNGLVNCVMVKYWGSRFGSCPGHS